MKLIPRPEQEADIQRMIVEPTKSILLASEMGTGKTLIASEFAVRLGLKRVLLIGVKDTFEQWAERLAEQSEGEIVLRRLDASKPGQAAFAEFVAGGEGYFFAGSQYLVAQDWDHPQLTDLNGEGLTKLDAKAKSGTATFSVSTDGTVQATRAITTAVQLKVYAKMKALDAIIFDEVHVIANRKAVGRKTLITIKSEWKLAMSGTWYRNSFEGAWSITRWLWKDRIIANFATWSSQWCTTEEVYLKGGKSTTKVTGEKFPGEYVKTLPLYIRQEAEELPPAPAEVYVDLTPAQRAQYDDLERDLLVYIESHQGTVALVADLPIVLRSRLRTATLGEMAFDENGDIGFDYSVRSSKLHALRAVVDSPEYSGRRVAIYTDSKKFAKVTVARMRAAGYNAVEWSGDVTSANRAKIKAAFIAGEIQFLVCVIGAFNAGLDGFQKVCNRVIWLSESEDNTDNLQAIMRFFRPGRVGEFHHTKILANDTHDVGIYSHLINQALSSRATMKIAA